MAVITNFPANDTAKPAGEHKRIPMSVSLRRLEVPEIPGWHLHWFLENRITRAQQGGYTFVKDSEVTLNNRGVGTDGHISGNISLGTNVVQIGGTGEDGKPEQLVLMKIRQEWWDEDKAKIDSDNANRLAGIFKGESIIGTEGSEDRGTRYVDKSRTKALFLRPPRKS